MLHTVGKVFETKQEHLLGKLRGHYRSFQSDLSVGDKIEYVNQYIPTQTPEEDWSDHMQAPGWQPALLCGHMSDLVICKFRNIMVIHDTECPYWDQVSLTLKLPGPAAGMGGSLTVTVA